MRIVWVKSFENSLNDGVAGKQTSKKDGDLGFSSVFFCSGLEFSSLCYQNFHG